MKFASIKFRGFAFLILLPFLSVSGYSQGEKFAKKNEPRKIEGSRYLNNNEKKRNPRKIVTVDNWDCSSYGLFISRSKEKRDKLHDKRQKEIRKKSKKNRR